MISFLRLVPTSIPAAEKEMALNAAKEALKESPLSALSGWLITPRLPFSLQSKVKMENTQSPALLPSIQPPTVSPCLVCLSSTLKKLFFKILS